MKLYRQVPVTERLPEKEGHYFTSVLGFITFHEQQFWSHSSAMGMNKENPKWWLEELPELPTE